jgi:hypothetical protein
MDGVTEMKPGLPNAVIVHREEAQIRKNPIAHLLQRYQFPVLELAHNGSDFRIPVVVKF